MFSAVGGKSKSRDLINKMIPPHKIYVEPFVGGGSIFFSKEQVEKEVINDLNKNVYNIYKDTKVAGDKLKSFDFGVNKERFNRLKNKTSFSSPQERLYKNLYMKYASYGGKGQSVGAAQVRERHGRDGLDLGRKWKTDKWKKRLSKVTILNQDFKKVVKKYDSPNTFFFLDPPYSQLKGASTWGDDYSKNAPTPEGVFDVVKNIKGKFLLTYDDTPAIRRLFNRFHIKGYKVAYELQGRNAKGGAVFGKELMIMNYTK